MPVNTEGTTPKGFTLKENFWSEEEPRPSKKKSPSDPSPAEANLLDPKHNRELIRRIDGALVTAVENLFAYDQDDDAYNLALNFIYEKIGEKKMPRSTIADRGLRIMAKTRWGLELSSRTKIPSSRWAVDLMDDRVEEMEFVIDDLILDKDVTVISSPAGGGKTTAAVLFTYALATGDSIFDLPEGAVRAPGGRTLFIASDANGRGASMMKSYVSMIMEAYTPEKAQKLLDPNHVTVWAARSDLGLGAWKLGLRTLDHLYYELKENQESDNPYRMVIIDSLKSVAESLGLKHGVADPAFKTWFNLLVEMVSQFCACVVIHHSLKGGGDREGVERVGGIAEIIEKPGAVFTMQKATGEDGARVNCLNIDKLRGCTPRSILYQWDREKGIQLISNQVKLKGAKWQHILRVMEDIGSEQVSVGEISAHMKLDDKNVVSRELTRMKKTGLVTKEGCSYACWKITKEGWSRINSGSVPDLKALQQAAANEAFQQRQEKAEADYGF